jgi:hypothetical protein
MIHRLSCVALGAVSAVCVALSAAPAAADVKAGDVITKENVGLITDLVSPGIKWCVERGMRLSIVDPESIPLPKAYLAATEQYSSQVKIREDGLAVENWVAGQPFPNIDTNDPNVAKKIMYNYEARWGETDDLDITNFDADTGAIGKDGSGMTVEKHFILDHFKRLYYRGRLHVDPKPAYEPNKDEARYKESLHPIIEPFDLKGTGFTYYRYLDPNRHDDSWLYLPQLRRVRRLSSAQRSDALFGQDTDLDSYGGYAGSIAWSEWKYLGEKTILASMHGKHWPVKYGEGEGDFAFEDVWEKRDVYVVEAKSKLPQYAYSKRVIYVDKEAWVIPYTDIYDQAGELWKLWGNLYRMRKAPFDGAPPSGVYEDTMPWLPSIFMVDMQLDHATRAALPSNRFEREVGWSFNKNEATEDFFTIASLIASGR